MKPLVSVIIPTYNRAVLLGQALDSVVTQEGAGEQFDMEVIVVDDGSTDATPEVVRRYSGVQYIRLETHRGASATRNAGIRASRGIYVSFLDDDDQWLHHKLSVQIPVLETRPEVGVVYGQSIIKGNGVDVIRPEARFAPSGNVFRAFLMKELISVNTPLIRREAFQMAGYFDENLPTSEHVDMFLRLAFHVPFVFLPGAVAIGHVNKQGKFLTKLRGESGYVQIIPYVVERALAMLQGTEDYAHVRREVLASLVRRIFYWLGKIEGAERMRNHLFSALKTYPWITTNPSVRVSAARGIGKVGSALASESDSPIAAVRAFFAEVKSVAGRLGPRDWLRIQRLLAGAWTEVARALERGSERRDRVAGYAAALAVFHDPSQLRRKLVLKLLVRAVFAGPRWDPIFALLKRCIKTPLPWRTELISDSTRRKQQEWSIGIYMGKSPLDFMPPANVDNPVLTRADLSDVQAVFVADPFMMRANHTWYMFFEVWNQENAKGEIGLASSNDGMKWTYQQIVLTEPFHLSYPYVFKWRNDYYMIPETHQIGCIRLYKALKFPTRWSFIGTLLSGQYFSDPSIFRYEGKWWLFTETSLDSKHDTLRLYYADELTGPWLEHPNSPIIEGNAHIARPAGRVLVLGDRVVRYAQDCYPTYGTQVRAFEITDLTTTSYREQEVDGNPVLDASGAGWNESGMHHIDPHLMDDGRWIACVDGWFYRKAEAENRLGTGTSERPALKAASVI